MNYKKISLVLISLVPNAYVFKAMLSALPDLTIMFYFFLYVLMVLQLFKGKKLIYRPFDIFAMVWVLYLIVSSFYTPYQIAGLYKIAKLVFMGLGLIYFIRLNVEDEKDFDFLIKSLLVSSVVLQLIVSVTFVQQGMPFGRFEFEGVHPIPLGMVGAATSIIAMGAYTSKKMTLPYFLPLYALSWWTVLLSSSKGPLLSGVLGLLLLLPVLLKHKGKAFLFTIIMGICYWLLSKTDQYQFMVGRLMEKSEGPSSIARLGLYKQAIDYGMSHPLKGAGVGIFQYYYPHNIFLEVFAEGGLFLVVLLVIGVVWLGIKGIEYIVKRRNDYYFAISYSITLAAFLVLLFSFTYVDLKFLWLGLGLVLINNKRGSFVVATNLSAAKEAKTKRKLSVKFGKRRIVW